MAITKRTTSYSVTIHTVAGDEFVISDSDAAYTAIQDYKAKHFIKVPPAEAGAPALYIPYHSISKMVVQTETSTESVADVFCVEG
jgi:hypothetical protein